MVSMNRKAFTLIEVYIAISVIAIIAAVLAPFISTLADSWLFSRAERDVVFSARLAINRMVREIREIKNTASIFDYGASSFTFVNIDDSTVNFSQSGSSLMRNSNELLNKLQVSGGLTFTYLDSAGAVTAVKADIRRVRIRLVVTSMGRTLTIESLARFRNT